MYRGILNNTDKTLNSIELLPSPQSRPKISILSINRFEAGNIIWEKKEEKIQVRVRPRPRIARDEEKRDEARRSRVQRVGEAGQALIALRERALMSCCVSVRGCVGKGNRAATFLDQFNLSARSPLANEPNNPALTLRQAEVLCSYLPVCRIEPVVQRGSRFIDRRFIDRTRNG